MDDHSSGMRITAHLDATDPDDSAETRFSAWRTTRTAIPIWSCSRWGLPCRCCYQLRGALLPHLFTLTSRSWRFVFCGTFPGVAPAGRYPAPCFRGARTFLCLPKQTAAIRPSGTGRTMSARPAEVKVTNLFQTRLCRVVSPWGSVGALVSGLVEGISFGYRDARP
jgi:hypothetical protein